MNPHTPLGFITEIDFELPKGYVDASGTLHRRGTMRLATAADEILPLRDPRVQQNEAYLAVIVLARVVTRLGSLPEVSTSVIEGLFASDLAYLERLYEQINTGDGAVALDVPMSSGGPTRRMAVVGEA
jgi:hypothetical protein